MVPEWDFLLFLRKHAVDSAMNCSLWESAALICRCSPVTWPAYFASFFVFSLFLLSYVSKKCWQVLSRVWVGLQPPRCSSNCGPTRLVVCYYKYVCCAFTCAERQDPPLFPPPWCFILCVHTARLVFHQSVSGSEELRLGISLFLRVICQVGRSKQHEWLVQIWNN